VLQFNFSRDDTIRQLQNCSHFILLPIATLAKQSTMVVSMQLLLVAVFLALLAACTICQVEAQQECGLIKLLGDLSALEGLQLAIHRSGEVEPCSRLVPITTDLLIQALSVQGLCDMTEIDRFDVDALLTAYFLRNLGDNECGPVIASASTEGDDAAAAALTKTTLADFCDQGPALTPIQPDHSRLKAVVEKNTLPCRFYTREGRVVRSLDVLSMLANRVKQGAAASCEAANSEEADGTCSAAPILHLTAVPAGRVFMLAPSYVGEKFIVDYVPDWHVIEVEVISVEPRLFELKGFFTHEEADNLVELALSETADSHRLKRSTTGSVTGSVYE
jgi:hypothetical protein